MKKLTFGFLVLATALAITASASADRLIVGSIGIGGGNDKWNSTAVTFTPQATRLSQTKPAISWLLYRSTI